jgi:hypothetical protein
MSLSDAIRSLIGEQGAVAVAGAAGGVVRWLTLRENWKEGLINITVGAICAIYLEPVALPALEPVLGKVISSPAKLSNLAAFLVGIGGIAVSGFVLDLWAWRRRQINGGGGK